MSTAKLIEYRDASAEVRAVFDDIKKSRNVEDVNNFWKVLAHDPATLKRTWESIKEVMAPGALDPLTKAIRETLDDPATKKALTDLGVDVVNSTPEKLRAYIKSEIPKWAKVVKASGAKVE